MDFCHLLKVVCEGTALTLRTADNLVGAAAELLKSLRMLLFYGRPLFEKRSKVLVRSIYNSQESRVVTDSCGADALLQPVEKGGDPNVGLKDMVQPLSCLAIYFSLGCLRTTLWW